MGKAGCWGSHRGVGRPAAAGGAEAVVVGTVPGVAGEGPVEATATGCGGCVGRKGGEVTGKTTDWRRGLGAKAAAPTEARLLDGVAVDGGMACG